MKPSLPLKLLAALMASVATVYPQAYSFDLPSGTTISFNSLEDLKNQTSDQDVTATGGILRWTAAVDISTWITKIKANSAITLDTNGIDVTFTEIENISNKANVVFTKTGDGKLVIKKRLLNTSTWYVNGGTLEMSRGKAYAAIGGTIIVEDGGTLLWASANANGWDAYYTSSDGNLFGVRDLTIKKGGILHLTSSTHHGANLLLTGGTITTTNKDIRLRFGNGVIKAGLADGENDTISKINGHMELTDGARMENNASVAIKDVPHIFEVDEKATLEITKEIFGANQKLTKTGKGTLRLSGEWQKEKKQFIINEGIFELSRNGPYGIVCGTAVINDGGKMRWAIANANGWEQYYDSNYRLTEITVEKGGIFEIAASTALATNLTLNGGMLMGSGIVQYGNGLIAAGLADSETATTSEIASNIKLTDAWQNVSANHEFNTAQGATLHISGTIEAADKLLTKTGAGTLFLDADNNALGGTIDVQAGELKAGHDAAFGSTLVKLTDGTINLNGKAVANDIEITKGNLAGAQNKTTGNVRINQTALGDISLGGLNGARLQSLVLASPDQTPSGPDTISHVTGLTGNVSLAGTTSLGVSSNMIGSTTAEATGTAVTFDGAGSLAFGGALELNLTTTAHNNLLAAFNAFQNQYIHLSNGSLSATGTMTFAGNYHTMNDRYEIEIDSATGYLKLVNKNQPTDRLDILQGASYFVIAYDDAIFNAFKGIDNNGTLKIDLSSAPGASNPDGLLLKDLKGDYTGVVDTRGSSTDAVITLVDDGEASHLVSTFRGSIIGNAQIVKAGDAAYDLTIGSQVQASKLTVQSGKLTVHGNLDIAGDTVVDANTTFVSNGSNSTINGNFLVNGTAALGDNAKLTSGALTLNNALSLGNNAVLSTGDLIGNGTLAMSNSELVLTGPTTALEAGINGNGSVRVQNGQLTLGTNGHLGAGIMLELDQTGGFILDAANDGRNTIAGLNGTGKVTANGGALLIVGNGGTFSGSYEGSTPASIEYQGSGKQTMAGPGSNQIDLIQSGPGTLSIEYPAKARDLGSNPATYRSLTINSGLVTSNTRINLDTLNLNGGGMSVEVTEALATSGNAIITAGNSVVEPASGKFVFSLEGVGDNTNWLDSTYTINLLDAPNNLTEGLYNIELNNYLLNIGFMIASIDYTRGLKITLETVKHNPLLNKVNNSNAAAAADMLWNNRASFDPNGTLTDILLKVTRGGLSDQEIANSLSALSGSSITSLLTSTREGLDNQVRSLRNRVVQMGLSDGYNYNDLPYYNMWIQGNGGYSRLDQRGDEAGFDLETWGGTVGADVNITQRWTAGAAFTANYGKLRVKSYDYAKGDNDGYYANVFARYQHRNWSHVIIGTFGWNDIELKRTVSISGMDPLNTRGTTDGRTYGAFYEGAYDFSLNHDKTAVLQPIVNASIYHTEIDSYTELGAGDASMRASDMDATYGSAAIGARIMGMIGANVLGRNTYAEFRVLGFQDYGDKTNHAVVTPIGAPSAGMSVKGAKAGRTGIQVGGGLAIPVGEQSSVFVDADASFKKHVTNVTGTLGYRYNF